MRIFIISALIFALAFTVSPFVFAQPLENAKRDVEQLQEKLENAVEKYNYACSKLEDTKAEIDENQEKLTVAEKELAANKTRLNRRVRAMYVTRHNKFLDVVVNAGNFDEFLVGIDLAKKVGKKDAELVYQVKVAKANLEAAKQALAEKKSEQEAARREMASTKASVERDLSGAKGKLANVENEIRQAMARRAAEAANTRTVRRSGSTYSSISSIMPKRPPSGSPHGGVVDVAYSQIGKPYVWGASGPDSFDCSGLTAYCYEHGAGISITHSSYGQMSCGEPVPVDCLQPGDIVVFRGGGHVGIYIGGGQYIHAPHSGAVVSIGSLSSRGYFTAVRP